jgi:dihydroorotate dehydrogenase (NAD+) catalytic subunit
MADLRVNAAGLKLKNPLLAASGCFGYGREAEPVISADLFGGIVTKTITPVPRRGNPLPRLGETPSGMLNSIGLENVGLDVFLAEKLPVLEGVDTRVVVSISAASAEEFAEMARRLADESRVDALELNLSCPNVAEHGRNFAADPVAVGEITRRVRPHFAYPIWVKLSPNVTDIVASARAAQEAGADGVTAINTLLGMDIDLDTGASHFARVTAGLSGPAILPVALAAVWRIAHEAKIPTVGVGGASSAEDVLKFLAAGASAVQLGTVLLADPGAPERILKKLTAYLDERGIENLDVLHHHWKEAP